MPYTIKTADGKARLIIEETLTVYDAPALHGELLRCFENGIGITMDVGGVTECDTAGIQLLYAARKNARESRQPFAILGESNAIMETVRRLGLNTDEMIHGSRDD